MMPLLRDVSLRCNITLLRYAADRLHQERVAAASSLREIASGVGTSTRAGYSLSGSKEGLLDTLHAHAMEMLHQWGDAMAVSRHPARQSRRRVHLSELPPPRAA